MPSRLGLTTAGLLAVLLPLALATAASHADGTLPATAEDPAVADGLDWIEAEKTGDSGCIKPHDYNDTCFTGAAKWTTATLASLGVDPRAWPSPEANLLDWMLDNADDIHDNKYKSPEAGCGGEDQSSFCQVKKVNSLAKTVFAFQAAGEDPAAISHPDETGDEIDFVERLLATHDGNQFGSSSHVNDDIWGLIALHSIGYDGPEVERSADFVASTQDPTGGYGYDDGTGSSSDTTAAAIMALAPLDREDNVESALGYLERTQIQEGETKACWGQQLNADEGNAASTAWAIQGLVAAGEDPVAWNVDDRTPIECLTIFQEDDGGFANTRTSAANFPNTQYALAALAWAPYGSLTQPNEALTVHDEATVDRQHTATLPGGVLRIGESSVAEHDWTPEETGEQVFHGFTWDPPRPATLVVEVEEAEETSSDGSSGSQSTSSGGSGSTGSGTSSSADAGDPPTVRLDAPQEAERNVTFDLTVEGQPGDDAVTAFRLQVADREPTDWQPAGSFETTARALGGLTLQAWARDAEGRVSQPAEANVHVVDAAPRIEIDGPEVADRSTPTPFEADAWDPDGDMVNVTWVGPDGGEAEGVEALLSFEHPGVQTIEARATDRPGNTANATWTVHARNRAPVNLTVEPGELAANASEVVRASAEDPDGDDLTVAWRFPDEEEPSSWGRQLHLATGPPGERELLVNVSDAHGAWTTARVTIPVREEPDEAETSTLANLTRRTDEPETGRLDPAPDQPPATVELPDAIEAEADESRLLHVEATGPNGPIVNVTVALGGPLPVQGTEQATALLPALPAGEYELAARAADPAGWGPWTNATLVVQQSVTERSLEPAGGASAERATPLGAIVASIALASAARGTRR